MSSTVQYILWSIPGFICLSAALGVTNRWFPNAKLLSVLLLEGKCVIKRQLVRISFFYLQTAMVRTSTY